MIEHGPTRGIYVVLFSTPRQMLEQYLHYAMTISFHVFSIQVFSPIGNGLGGTPSHVFIQLVAGLKRPAQKNICYQGCVWMSGAKPPFAHTPSWRDSSKKKKSHPHDCRFVLLHHDLPHCIFFPNSQHIISYHIISYHTTLHILLGLLHKAEFFLK